MVLIPVTGWVDPTAKVRLERFSQQKIPMAPSGIEHATFRLAAQSLNQLRTPIKTAVTNKLGAD